MAERLLLVGMMGAGKSTVGPLVAQRLGWSFVGTDEEVERSTGKSIPELFESGGEALFRREESRVLAEVLRLRAIVVSVGGGAVLEERNRDLLGRSGLVVWLRAKPETLVRRVGDGGSRPLLVHTGSDPSEELARIDADRRSLYEQTADAVVDVDGLTATEVAEAVVALYQEGSSAERLCGGSRRP